MPLIRKSSGSVLILLILVSGILVLFCIFCFTFNNLLFQCTNSQERVDSLCLKLVGIINQNDRVAQMNQLEARSRELVYTSRQRLSQCHEAELEFLEPLCQMLLTEAKFGHQMLESERKNQTSLICAEICNSALNSNQAASDNKAYKLAFMKTEEPMIWRIDVGQISNVNSSVKCQTIFSDLNSYDKKQSYASKNSLLFKPGVNVSLPGPDSEVKFKFSTLPARVDGFCTPARNINSDVFIPQGTIFNKGEIQENFLDEIPSVLRVVFRMKAEFNEKQEFSIPLISLGTVCGSAISADQ